jgi:hypothetical protein
MAAERNFQGGIYSSAAKAGFWNSFCYYAFEKHATCIVVFSVGLVQYGTCTNYENIFGYQFHGTIRTEHVKCCMEINTKRRPTYELCVEHLCTIKTSGVQGLHSEPTFLSPCH